VLVREITPRCHTRVAVADDKNQGDKLQAPNIADYEIQTQSTQNGQEGSFDDKKEEERKFKNTIPNRVRFGANGSGSEDRYLAREGRGALWAMAMAVKVGKKAQLRIFGALKIGQTLAEGQEPDSRKPRSHACRTFAWRRSLVPGLN
jgi:hypothetical protein